MLRITSIVFNNYKSFQSYSVSISPFNILVGPNNAGKSTIIGAFRLLAEALRKARSRKPVLVNGPIGTVKGYQIGLEDISIAVENVFYNYDNSKPAKISFRLSNGNKLLLFFPEEGKCLLIPQSDKDKLNSTIHFKKYFDVLIGFVPILGPVEHNEQLYQKKAARNALVTHRAARNFRNIWYHYPDEFQKFKELLQTTWPGMDINPPTPEFGQDKTYLYMFCPEERIPREIYWAGFGFQVWCQMLTYIVQNKNTSIFLIDEPDIYLHSDLQRQLLMVLKNLGPDIILATHSTELVIESDPDDILIVNKKNRSAKRLKKPENIKLLFSGLGSNINPIITQTAKTQKVIFVEGKDFQIISLFAAKMGLNKLATRADFAVIPAGGFNPQKVLNYIEGIELTLGSTIRSAVIFDRDYRSQPECQRIESKLSQRCELVKIHTRKELENFVLAPAAISEALAHKLGIKPADLDTNIKDLLTEITEDFKAPTFGNYSSLRTKYLRAEHPNWDISTINETILKSFEKEWNNFASRIKIVPGKAILAKLNSNLQKRFKITLTPSYIVMKSKLTNFPDEMRTLLSALENFRR